MAPGEKEPCHQCLISFTHDLMDGNDHCTLASLITRITRRLANDHDLTPKEKIRLEQLVYNYAQDLATLHRDTSLE